MKENFNVYKGRFVSAIEQILSEEGSQNIFYSALPIYATKIPLKNFLFWQRVRKVMLYLDIKCRGAVILDFGCGGGVMLPFLTQRGRRVVAFDKDLSALKKMARFFSFENVELHDNVKTLTNFNSSFDFILALDVLEHVDALDETIEMLTHLLTPGGELIVSGPTENLFYKFGRLLAGSKDDGHLRSIYNIESALAKHLKVRPIATLYYPIPLFQIYTCSRE